MYQYEKMLSRTGRRGTGGKLFYVRKRGETKEKRNSEVRKEEGREMKGKGEVREAERKREGREIERWRATRIKS